VTGKEIDYFELAMLLDGAGAPLVLAELHGGLCGIFCAGGPAAGSQWLDELLDDCTANAGTLGELAQNLDRLGASTWEALNGSALQFSPLLPGDDDALNDRADALALWCHGFLSGLVIGGLDLSSGQADLAPELTELVQDLAEISKAGAAVEEIEDLEGSEVSLIELVEFVRVGVQFVFEELTPEPVSPDQRVLH
jgi:hypothetical protein